jgi:ubiquinone/menaquinone biosynthesis C-methylase UbiE
MARIEAFENHSDEYDRWFEVHSDLYEAELKALRQVLPPPEAEGMEVGVGSGRFALPLGIKIGVEPSKQMASKARTKGIKVYEAVAEALPFPDQRFDFVLMVTTICFVDDIAQSFREAYRVLKTGGHIIVGFVSKESQLGKQYIHNKSKSKFYKQAVFFSPYEIVSHLKQAGFQVSETRQTLIFNAPLARVESGLDKGAFVVIKAVKNKYLLDDKPL